LLVLPSAIKSAADGLCASCNTLGCADSRRVFFSASELVSKIAVDIGYDPIADQFALIFVCVPVAMIALMLLPTTCAIGCCLALEQYHARRARRERQWRRHAPLVLALGMDQRIGHDSALFTVFRSDPLFAKRTLLHVLEFLDGHVRVRRGTDDNGGERNDDDELRPLLPNYGSL
jgi:hypothetical protein